MSMFHNDGEFSPYSPFTHVYGDYQIEDVQDTLYYLTSRMRAILLHRLATPFLGLVSKAWNAHFSMEAQYASSLIGWVTLVGAAVDIPYLLRSICARGVFLTVDMRVTISSDMITLLEADPDAEVSPYLLPAPQYFSQWWDPIDKNAKQNIISHDTVISARIFHLQTLGRSRPLTPPPGPEPFHSANSKPYKLPKEKFPLKCKFCRYYRVLAYDAQTSVSEAVRHVQATAQFAEWSAAQTARHREALLVLYERAQQLGRPLTEEEVVDLATGPRHAGTGLGDKTMMPAETGSDYLLPLATGIDWDAFSTDYIPCVDQQDPPLSISSSIERHGNLRRSPSPPFPRHLEEAAAQGLTTDTLSQYGADACSFSIPEWGRQVPAGPPPEGPPRPSSPFMSTPASAPPLATCKLAVVLSPTAICPAPTLLSQVASGQPDAVLSPQPNHGSSTSPSQSISSSPAVKEQFFPPTATGFPAPASISSTGLLTPQTQAQAGGASRTI